MDNTSGFTISGSTAEAVNTYLIPEKLPNVRRKIYIYIYINVIDYAFLVHNCGDIDRDDN